MQKRVIAVHDISCVGRCSLTVALPVISAAGLECSLMPTALLSTHTGGFTDFTFLSLTEEMKKIASHWKSLSLSADAVYTGYLGSPEQIGIAEDIIKAFGGTAIVDPVMGDAGKLYAGFDSHMVEGMRRLCRSADVILPNITEACLLLDLPCNGTPPVPGDDTERVLRALHSLSGAAVVLSGVESDGKIGAAVYDGECVEYLFAEKYSGFYHGTGDVFGSALCSAVVRGGSLAFAARLAVNFTSAVVRRTMECEEDKRFGPVFEPELGNFSAELERSLGQHSFER